MVNCGVFRREGGSLKGCAKCGKPRRLSLSVGTMVAEQTFRRLDAPELLAEVAEGDVRQRSRVKPSPAKADEKAAA
jgi:hypothetical protein